MPALHTYEERLARAPQWVKNKISALENDNAHLRSRIADGPADSDTHIYGYFMAPDKPLRKGETILFLLPGNDWIQARVDGGVLKIMGSRSIDIAPVSSNLVTIAVPS